MSSFLPHPASVVIRRLGTNSKGIIINPSDGYKYAARSLACLPSPTQTCRRVVISAGLVRVQETLPKGRPNRMVLVFFSTSDDSDCTAELQQTEIKYSILRSPRFGTGTGCLLRCEAIAVPVIASTSTRSVQFASSGVSTKNIIFVSWTARCRKCRAC